MEYALLITGVAATVVLAIFLFGVPVSGLFEDTCDAVVAQTGTDSC